jgi:hypothetical protein
MPLAFVRREADEILEDTNQEEEYQRSTHRTIEGERARSGRSKVKKAPDTFSDRVLFNNQITSITESVVWIGSFSTSST